MILILSTRTDRSTFEVAEWLMYYKQEFIILYDDDVIEVNLIDSENFIIQCGEKLLNLNDISCFWHRTAFHKMVLLPFVWIEIQPTMKKEYCTSKIFKCSIPSTT